MQKCGNVNVKIQNVKMQKFETVTLQPGLCDCEDNLLESQEVSLEGFSMQLFGYSTDKANKQNKHNVSHTFD